MSTPGVNNPTTPTPPSNGNGSPVAEGERVIRQVMVFMQQLAAGEEPEAMKPRADLTTTPSIDTGDAYKRTGLWDVITGILQHQAPEFVKSLERIVRGEPEPPPPPQVDVKTGKVKKAPRAPQPSDSWLVRHAADIATGINIAAAPVSIGLVFNDHPLAAAGTLGVGVVVDRFDGFLARLTGYVSEAGAIFDDLGDMATFGVATPVVATMAAAMDPRLALPLGAAYTLSAAWRLRNFVTAPQRNGFFTGLPTTAAATHIASALILGGGRLPFEAPMWVGALGLAGLGVLMNAPVVYRKFAGPSRPSRTGLISFGGASVLSIATFGFWETTFAALTAYVVSGPLETAYRAVTKKPFPAPEPRPTKVTLNQAYELMKGGIRLAFGLNANGNGHGPNGNGAWQLKGATPTLLSAPTETAAVEAVRPATETITLVDIVTVTNKTPRSSHPEGDYTTTESTHGARPGSGFIAERPGARDVERPGERPPVRPGTESSVRPGETSPSRPGATEPARPDIVETRPGSSRPDVVEPARKSRGLRPH